jgi:hypothetical protein
MICFCVPSLHSCRRSEEYVIHYVLLDTVPAFMQKEGRTGYSLCVSGYCSCIHIEGMRNRSLRVCGYHPCIHMLYDHSFQLCF